MKSKLICIVIIVSSFISGYFTCFSIKQNQVDKKVNDISLEGTFQDERFDKISLYNNLTILLLCSRMGKKCLPKHL